MQHDSLVVTVTPTPVARVVVSAGSDFAVGNAYACGLSPAELSYCWGDNASGELGDGTTTDRSTPTLIAGQQ